MKRRIKVSILLKMYRNFDRGIFRGIAAYAKESGQWWLHVEHEQDMAVSAIGELDMQGMIVNLNSDIFADAVRRLKVPMVGLGGGGGQFDPASGVPYVTSDNQAIGRMAAEHLLDTGLRHFAFCGFKPGRRHDWMIDREAAFRERLAQSGFSCDVFRGSFAQGVHSGDSLREITNWLRKLPKPLGIMGCYDWRAQHLLEACHRLDLTIPDDVAVIGVDNDPMLCEVTDPALSSVEQAQFTIGFTAAKLLDQLMKGRRVKKQVHIVPPLGVVTRQSTNLLATSDAEMSLALRTIREKACAGLTANALAERFHISRTTLDQRMKNAIGRTADQEIRRVRLAMAENLLIHSSLPLREIAVQSGLGTEQYLCVAWKKEKGSTPGDFRSLHRVSRGMMH